MDCYTDFCECFKNDDYKSIKELMDNLGIPSALAVAASYSDEKRTISNNMARVLIQNAIEEASMHYAIWLFDEMINRENDYVVEEPLMNLISNELLAHLGVDEGDVKPMHQQLIEYIGTCSVPDFNKFLSFISGADVVLILSGDTILVILERIRRCLHDDRVFFLVMYSAFVSNKFEAAITDFNVSQMIALNHLQEAGYQIEMVAGTVGVYIAHQPGTSDAHNAPSPSATKATGTDWVANMPRRNSRRRR